MKTEVFIKRISGILLCLAAVTVLSGCGTIRKPAGSGETQREVQKLKVVTTLFPYYDFTRQIAGDQVELSMVISAGMDSHSFEPTPADMLTIQNADLLICNGGEMEQWLEQVLDALESDKIRVIRMMDYVDTVEEELVEGMEDHGHGHGDEEEHRNEETHGKEEHETHGHSHNREREYVDYDGYEQIIEYDEHIWTSPVNAMKFTEVICETLSQEEPEHAALFRENADRYLSRLKELDQAFRRVSKQRKRNLIVLGDKFPFRYLAEEYQLDYRAAFSGCSTDTEPSAKTIAYLIDKVKQEKIPVVYYLELSSHRVAEIIGEETEAVPLLLHSCHNVTRREFEHGVTYLELMEQNVENLRRGLDE